MTIPLRVLLIEDSEDDAELFLRHLRWLVQLVWLHKCRILIVC